MATIDVTVANPYDIAGIRRRTVGQYTGPASYATGGDPFTAAEVQIGVLDLVIFAAATDGTTVRLLAYDHAAAKVKWFVASTGVEVANTTDLSSFNARFEAIGQ